MFSGHKRSLSPSSGGGGSAVGGSKRIRSATSTPPSTTLEEPITLKQSQTMQWTHIAQDHMQAITEFIDIKELGRLSRVCGDWRRTINQVADRWDVFYCGYAQLFDLLQSPSRRHITELAVCNSNGITGTKLIWDSYSLLSPLELRLIGREMTRLTWFGCAIDVTAQPSHMDRQLPPVKGISIRMMLPASTPGVAVSWSHIRRCLTDISRVTTLTKLMMDFHSDARDHASRKISPTNMPDDTLDALSPLYGRLTDLRIVWNEVRVANLEWPTAHLTQLRRFTRLIQLDLDQARWTARELSDLFAAPFTMPLTQLDLTQTTITEGMAESLARATEFTKFEPEKLNLPNASFLSSYRQLTVCRLICTAAVNVDLLVAALSHCTLISKFMLGHPTMSNDQLERLLTHLTNVTSLELVDMGAVATLSFMSSIAHFANGLETFRLTLCRMIPVVELIHLRSLSSLASLSLTGSLVEPLDSFTLSLLTGSRDSAFDSISRIAGAFTHLKTFEYTNCKR